MRQMPGEMLQLQTFQLFKKNKGRQKLIAFLFLDLFVKVARAAFLEFLLNGFLNRAITKRTPDSPAGPPSPFAVMDTIQPDAVGRRTYAEVIFILLPNLSSAPFKFPAIFFHDTWILSISFSASMNVGPSYAFVTA